MGNGDIVVEWGGDQTRLKGLVLISSFETDGPMGSSSYFSISSWKDNECKLRLVSEEKCRSVV